MIHAGGVLKVYPFSQGLGAPKALQYKLEVYSNVCFALPFREVVVVGVSNNVLSTKAPVGHPLNWNSMSKLRAT